MERRLTYNDLRLGEASKEAFLKGENPLEISGKYPVYLNTRPFFANLNVTDLAIAAILGGLNALYVGDTGTGKSQLAQDMFNYYFGGNASQGGNGVKIRGRPELDIYTEVYTKLNIQTTSTEPTENIKARYHFVDELNRTPEVAQNQFFGIGDGFLEHKGMKAPLGKRDGYSICVATANLGNGEFQGTFETDKALYNRFPVVIDFDYEKFKPTREDLLFVDSIRAANPKVKESPTRDISDLIVEAEKEISNATLNPGLEIIAVQNFLRFGLTNCQQYGSKEKGWPMQCQDCTYNKNDDALCSLIRAPVTRTSQALIKYIASLDLLAKLKDPQKIIDPIDLAFKAFEIIGSYQRLLNPAVLRAKYREQNPVMISEVVEKIKEDFRKNEGFILDALDKSKRTRSLEDYFQHEGKVYSGYSSLSEKAKSEVRILKPFTDSREIGLSWVKNVKEAQSKINHTK